MVKYEERLMPWLPFTGSKYFFSFFSSFFFWKVTVCLCLFPVYLVGFFFFFFFYSSRLVV